MLIYIFIFIISALLGYIYEKTEKNIFLLLSIFIISIFSGIRYLVGTDYNNYIDIWYKLKDISFLNAFKSSFEIVNFFICKISVIINPEEPQVYFFIYAVLNMLFLYKAILISSKKYIFYKLLVYFTLFFAFSLNGVRQGLAITIILCAFAYLEKGNNKKFLLLTILAIFTHTTAIIVLPFFFYDSKNKTLKKVIIIYIMIIILMFFVIENMYRIPQLMRYMNYFTDYESSEIGLGVLLKKAPLILIYLIFFKNINKTNKNTKLYVFLLIMDFLMSYLGYYSYYLNRFALYFSVIQVFAIPDLINILKGKQKIIIKVLIICFLFSIFTYEVYYLNANEIIPYRSIYER